MPTEPAPRLAFSPGTSPVSALCDLSSARHTHSKKTALSSSSGSLFYSSSPVCWGSPSSPAKHRTKLRSIQNTLLLLE